MLNDQARMQGPRMTAISDVIGFQARVSEAFFPYELESVSDVASFVSAAAAGNIGPLKISRTYVGNPFTGRRSRVARENERNAYVLMLVEEGIVHFCGKRRAIANSGDLILLNADSSLETHQEVCGCSLAISIPASLLRLRYATAEDWCLTPLPTDEGAAGILRDCLTSYWGTHTALKRSECNDLVMSLIHLIAASFRNRCEMPRVDSQCIQAQQ